MANCGYLFFKEPVKSEKIQSLLEEVNTSFFKDAWNIAPPVFSDGEWYWFLELKDNKDDFYYLEFYLSKDNLSLYWYNRGSDIMWWIRDQMVSRIGEKIPETKVGDEGVGDERWDPDFHIKYPTILDWVRRTRGKNSDKLVELFNQYDRNEIPASLQSFIGE